MNDNEAGEGQGEGLETKSMMLSSMLRDTILPRPLSVKRARRLRRNETPAERRLRLQLQNRQFRGLKFRRQAPLGPFIVDFLCVGRKLIIELDGAFHAKTKEYDKRREEFLREHGFTILRYENKKVFQNCDAILADIAAHCCHSRPSP